MRELSKVAPVIALGQPGEWLPPLGAARLYISHHNWAAYIHPIVSHARLVVVQIGYTEGLLWELAYLRDNVQPTRLVLYAPRSLDHVEFETARSFLEVALRTTLPRVNDCYFVAFDSGWQAGPLVAPLKSEVMQPQDALEVLFGPFVGPLPGRRDPREGEVPKLPNFRFESNALELFRCQATALKDLISAIMPTEARAQGMAGDSKKP